MISISKSIKSVRLNTSNFKSINNVALRRLYSTEPNPGKAAGDASKSTADANVPPYQAGECYGRGWGWNGWNNADYYNYYGYRRHRRRGFFLFMMGFAGGIIAHKAYSGSDCARERAERRRKWENYIDQQFPVSSTNQTYSNSDSLSSILISLPIVTSLRSDPEYKECKILENSIITPSTNSTFEDSIVLPIKPVEFINQTTNENISILSLPDLDDRRFKRHYGWGRDRKHRNGGFNDTLVMIIDEYMKQNASKVMNIPESTVYTQSLNVDFKSWFNNYNNIVLKTSVVQKNKETNNVVINGTIMTTEGRVITKVNGIFTGDSSKAPKEAKEVYSFRKWVWTE